MRSWTQPSIRWHLYNAGCAFLDGNPCDRSTLVNRRYLLMVPARVYIPRGTTCLSFLLTYSPNAALRLCSWQRPSWYRAQSSGLGYIRDWLSVLVGYYSEMPGLQYELFLLWYSSFYWSCLRSLRSHGYRLEELVSNSTRIECSTGTNNNSIGSCSRRNP